MEAHLLWVRASIIALNAVLFMADVSSSAPMYVPALLVIITSAAYAAGLLAFKPYLRWPVLSASLFTTCTDSVFITLWVLFTGGPDSPYYLLYHVSVASIAIRFSLRESLFAAAAYTISYAVLMLTTTHDVSSLIMPLTIRGSYVWFVALIVGRLASEERDRADETREIMCLHQDLARAQAALEHQALHDALTGLPNRRHFDARLAEMCRVQSPALLVLDLDGFKEVNDTLGHHVGDDLLRHVADRLRGAVREFDLVARLGGDEFALVLAEASPAEAELAAQRVVGLLAAPFALEGQTVTTGVSVGIALHPDDGVRPEALLRRADLAMYDAKRGRTGFARLAA